MRSVLVALGLGLALTVPAPEALGAVAHPARDARYHTYREMVDRVRRAEAEHPSIVRVFSLGRSHQDRKIWAAEISDHVGEDEGEPEVLFDGLHHAREPLSAEQAIDILRVLTNQYGRKGRLGRKVTRLVDSRRIWIVFMLNPDGLVHDLGGDPYRGWRKNRQPTPGSSSVGTDLNRNWGYRFGCCGGSSGRPASHTFRGPERWSAPETRALRDFVDSRVVDGVQRIRTHATLHTAGEHVLWPYAYTRADIPSDMTKLDHLALRTMGKAMAAKNSYRARQSSSVFRTDGDMIDWMFGRHRIFSYTFELYPRGGTARQRHYPPDEIIKRETRRNRSALLYLIARAGCPYHELGGRMRDRYCGPFFDDLEVDRGWVADAGGSDTATAGRWIRARPRADDLQLGTATSGRFALLTRAVAGRDVDGGLTTIRSPSFRVPTGRPTYVALNYWLGLGADSDAADGLSIHLVNAAGDRVATLLSINGDGTARRPRWKRLRAPIPNGLRGTSVAVEIEASDGGADSTVEAGIDQVRVSFG